MLDQKVHDSLHIHQPHGTLVVVKDGQSTITVFRHPANCQGNRVVFSDRQRVLDHFVGDRSGKISLLEENPNDVTLRENPQQPVITTNQKGSPMLLSENK